MRHLIKFGLILFLGVAALACSRAPESAHGGAKSPEALVKEFERAQKARDLDAMLALVSFERVEPPIQASLTAGLREDLDLQLKRVFYVPLLGDELFEYTDNGVTYRPNLPPVGRLEMEFEPVEDPSGMKRTASGYLVGTKGERYYIVTAAPAAE